MTEALPSSAEIDLSRPPLHVLAGEVVMHAQRLGRRPAAPRLAPCRMAQDFLPTPDSTFFFANLGVVAVATSPDGRCHYFKIQSNPGHSMQVGQTITAPMSMFQSGSSIKSTITATVQAVSPDGEVCFLVTPRHADASGANIGNPVLAALRAAHAGPAQERQKPPELLLKSDLASALHQVNPDLARVFVEHPFADSTPLYPHLLDGLIYAARGYSEMAKHDPDFPVALEFKMFLSAYKEIPAMARHAVGVAQSIEVACRATHLPDAEVCRRVVLALVHDHGKQYTSVTLHNRILANPEDWRESRILSDAAEQVQQWQADLDPHAFADRCARYWKYQVYEVIAPINPYDKEMINDHGAGGWTFAENMLMGELVKSGMDPEEARTRTDAILQRYHISAREHHLPPHEQTDPASAQLTVYDAWNSMLWRANNSDPARKGRLTIPGAMWEMCGGAGTQFAPAEVAACILLQNHSFSSLEIVFNRFNLPALQADGGVEMTARKLVRLCQLAMRQYASGQSIFAVDEFYEVVVATLRQALERGGDFSVSLAALEGDDSSATGVAIDAKTLPKAGDSESCEIIVEGFAQLERQTPNTNQPLAEISDLADQQEVRLRLNGLLSLEEIHQQAVWGVLHARARQAQAQQLKEIDLAAAVVGVRAAVWRALEQITRPSGEHGVCFNNVDLVIEVSALSTKMRARIENTCPGSRSSAQTCATGLCRPMSPNPAAAVVAAPVSHRPAPVAPETELLVSAMG